MQTTQKYRTHWIDINGTCYASGRNELNRPRFDLMPVINLQELASLRKVCVKHAMQDDAFYFYLGQIERHEHKISSVTIYEVAKEITDWIPLYHELFRDDFIFTRNMFPGFDGGLVVAAL